MFTEPLLCAWHCARYSGEEKGTHNVFQGICHPRGQQHASGHPGVAKSQVVQFKSLWYLQYIKNSFRTE